MCSRSFVCLTIVLVILPCVVGATTHHWSHPFGDSSDQQANSCAIDNMGNVIVVGDFDGTVNFGGGALTSGTATSVFLAKLDRYGNHVWSRSLGDSLKDSINKLTADGNGNVLIANDFRGTVDFGGGAIQAAGFRDGIIAKYDIAGNHIWSRSFGSANALVEVEAAGSDGAGNLIVAGRFTGTIDFGNGDTLDYTPFTTNMFLVKFNAQGNHVWSQKRTGGLIEITSLDGDDSGNVLLAGYHGDTFDFGGGVLDADLLNIYIAKYDSDGTHQWSKTFGDTGTLQYAFDAECDAAGNVFITGHFRDPLNLGGGALTSAGGWDIYLAKFDSGGNHVWSQSFGDGSTQRGYTLSTDAAGNVMLGGHFFGTMDFGGGPLVGDPIDFCVAQFDAAGAHQWSQRLDVDNLGLPNDKPYSIAAAANAFGEIAVVGSFKDGIDCGGGNLGHAGAWDTFVAKFGPAPTGIQPQSAQETPLRAHPNPFNPRTTIFFTNPSAGVVRLSVYDVQGRHVQTLLERWAASGLYHVDWDGRDSGGQSAASGVYFIRFENPRSVETRRVVLLK